MFFFSSRRRHTRLQGDWSSGSSDLKLAEHTIHDNFQVQLTHTTDNGLPGLRVGAQLEGWIFFREFVQSYRHLILVGTGPRLDGNVNDGSREVNGFQNNRFLWIA